MNSASEFQHGVEYHHSTIKTNTLSVDKLEESGISQTCLFLANSWQLDWHRLHSFPMGRPHKYRSVPDHTSLLLQETLGREKTRYLGPKSHPRRCRPVNRIWVYSDWGIFVHSRLIDHQTLSLRTWPCKFSRMVWRKGWWSWRSGPIDCPSWFMSSWDTPSYCWVGNFDRFALSLSFHLILFDREAKTASDVDFLVGFETEFILLKSTNPIQPISIHTYSSAEALRSGSTSAIVVAEMVHAIELSGIEVQIYHGEGAPGQVCHFFSQLKWDWPSNTFDLVWDCHWTTTSLTGCRRSGAY